MSCAFSAPTQGDVLPNVPFATLTLRWAIYKLRLQREEEKCTHKKKNRLLKNQYLTTIRQLKTAEIKT